MTKTEQFSAEQRQNLIWCLKACRHVDPEYDRDEFPELEENEALMAQLELGKGSGYTQEQLARLQDVVSEGFQFMEAIASDEYPVEVALAKDIDDFPHPQAILDLEIYITQLQEQ